MKVPSSVRQRLRDNRVLFWVLTAALLFITATYYVVLQGRDLDRDVVNNRVLLFFLRNVDAVLILALLFVLVRNLVKLWLERRQRVLGSKFKTKLVATYVLLALLPVLLLFAYANGLVQGSLDRLFRIPEDSLLEPGNRVAQALTTELQDRHRLDARLVLETIAGIDLADPNQRPALSRVLERQRAALGADLLAVYEDTEFVHALLDPASGVARLPELSQTLLLETLREGVAQQVHALPGRAERWIVAAVASPPANGARRTVVVAGSVLGAELARDTQSLVEAYQAQRQVLVQESDFRAASVLLLLMITLVILLTTIWVGLVLARRVTVPIGALAEGTRRIMSGDLDHRVEAPADDELGVLVDSFNRMTDDLQQNRAEIERSQGDLLVSNRQLDAERRLMGAVLQNVAAGVVSVDQDGTVLTCNSVALDMLGLEPQGLIGKGLVSAVEETALRGLFAGALAAPSTTRDEVRFTVDGDWKTFEVKSTPMLTEDAGVVGRVIVIEDLTELIQAQKLATWNEAARRVAHEIKNPLTPIKLSAERLLRKYRANDPSLGSALETAVGTIVREVDNMKAMVDEFARFARMPQPRPTGVDLRRLVDETVHLYRDIKPGLEVSASLEAAGDGHASLDPEQIRGALINLLDNAVEATQAPGQIRVSAQRLDNHLRIRVADTGPGIPADARDKLFMPYFSTKGRGTGLGLAIVHRIVSDHHGTIRVEDNVPHGAVFTIELPQ
ncbi:MAG TPA: ATP-binding protein [Thermoanaerobaculia bacterium]|nr:ATP-binding protein [Thermoanaerobaculia bacterium]